MPFESPLNMNSAMLVRDELSKSLEKTVQYMEAWLAEPADPQLLDGALQELHQINGSLRVVEFEGATELSSALLQVCLALQENRLDLTEAVTPILARGLVLLPRFIERSIKLRKTCPLALNDSLNQLRACVREAPLLEAAQIGFKPDRVPELDPVDAPELSAEDWPAIKRLHHMYQVGLVSVLRDRNTLSNLHLMERAVSRLRRDYSGVADTEWWLLVCATIHLMRTGALRTGFSRKRLLGAIDACLRKHCRDEQSEPMSLSEVHRDELLCLVELSGDKSELAETLREQYGLPAAPFDDAALAGIEEGLTGSEERALSAVAREIQDELGQVVDSLEVYRDAMTVEIAGGIAARLQKVGEILGRVGFNRLKGMLVDKAFQFNQSMAAGVIDRDAMQALAEALLMVDNTLKDPALFNDQALSMERPGSDMLAQSMLDEATGVVINESKSAIGMAKRGITAYLESNFDAAHVANVGTSLAMVHGAFQMLGHQRAARVLQQCINFIDSSSLQSAENKTRQSVETLADALISIEYYLDEFSVSDRENHDLLGIAEESISELGFAA